MPSLSGLHRPGETGLGHTRWWGAWCAHILVCTHKHKHAFPLCTGWAAPPRPSLPVAAPPARPGPRSWEPSSLRTWAPAVGKCCPEGAECDSGASKPVSQGWGGSPRELGDDVRPVVCAKSWLSRLPESFHEAFPGQTLPRSQRMAPVVLDKYSRRKPVALGAIQDPAGLPPEKPEPRGQQCCAWP